MTPEEAFKQGEDVFRDIKSDDIERIENALTVRYIREVDKVNVISYHGAKFVVPKFMKMALLGCKVEIRELPNLWFKIFYNGHESIKYVILEKENFNDRAAKKFSSHFLRSICLLDFERHCFNFLN